MGGKLSLDLIAKSVVLYSLYSTGYFEYSSSDKK